MTAEQHRAQPGDHEDFDDRVVALLQARSEEGVRLLLELHGSRTKGLLVQKFGERCEGTIEESLSDAALTIWFRADEFDHNRGTLGAWFFSCARNALRTVLRAERIRPLLESLDLEELLNLPAENRVPRSERLRRMLCRLESAVEALSDMQRDIILTDLAEGEAVKNADLAQKWETSTNSIHVSRNKAIKRLARMMGRRRP